MQAFAHMSARVLAGVMFLEPRYSKVGAFKLPRAWRSLAGWRCATASRSRVPHPLRFWCALATDLTSRSFLSIAILVLVSVSAYLGPSEALGIKKGDIIAPARGVTPCWSFLLFREELPDRSKAGTADDSLALDSCWTAAWLGPVLEVLSAGLANQRAFSFTYPEYLRQFVLSCRRLGVLATPFQARRSGASIDISKGYRSLETVQKRGRWKATKSVVLYEGAARLANTMHSYSARAQALMKLCEEHLAAIILGLPHLVGPAASGRTGST